ncbi:MAG TPA: BrnT family toxin, partial [Geminicoccaceae bacterium]
MRYEWDDAKDAENRRKHELSLRDGIAALRDPSRLEWIDDRFAYGEERVVTLGLSGQRLLFVVHT